MQNSKLVMDSPTEKVQMLWNYVKTYVCDISTWYRSISDEDSKSEILFFMFVPYLGYSLLGENNNDKKGFLDVKLQPIL